MGTITPRISIIIPCFNHGAYLLETLASIERSNDTSQYEVIIVNDGSSDPKTIEILNELKQAGHHTVLFQENQGVCRARNNALSIAKGDYILPVDADNLIVPDLLPKAIEILDNRPEVSIVYTDSMLFGEGKGVRVAGDFNLQRLMLGNFIDTCAVFRRSMIEQIGPYDTFHPLMEDWELWLRAAFNGYRFHYIPEPLFYYRILPNEKGSTNRSHAINNSKIKGDLNTEHIRERHSSYFGPQYVDAYFTDKFRASPLGMLTKLILKLYFPKRFARMVAKGKLRKYL